MPYISIHNYQKGAVEIYQYDDELIADLEQFVSDKVGHSDFEYMAMSELKLSINHDID